MDGRGVEGEGGRGGGGRGGGGMEDIDHAVSRSRRESYSSIQLIKIPLSKKPVKFRYVKVYMNSTVHVHCTCTCMCSVIYVRCQIRIVFYQQVCHKYNKRKYEEINNSQYQ